MTSSDHDRLLRSTVLIEAAELDRLIVAGQRPVILAVRAPDAPPAPPYDVALRIPGAIDASLASDFAAAGGGVQGSRPLPTIENLQRAARRWGISADSTVVVYDHDGGLQAARAWWVLRWAGLSHVRLLDGGFAAWQAAGLTASDRAIVPVPGDVVLASDGLPSFGADAAAAMARRGVLLDSRIAPNYEGGDAAPGEPARGHIPGAISLPAADNLDAHGRFRAPGELRALYASVGADGARPVGVYCGAGVSAAHDVLALASLGIDAPMYVGSWSAWSADPARPVARGPQPG